MKTSEILFFVGFGAVGTFIFTAMIRDWLQKRRILAMLKARPQYEDAQFARAFFPDPQHAATAVRVRRVLSGNLKLPLAGLLPGDRLNEDLNAELALNPHLFWELEEELGIKTGMDEDFESFGKDLERMVTFQNLVEFLESKTREPQTQQAVEPPNPRAYDLAIRAIPYLCICGFVTIIVGIVIQRKLLMNLGTVIFLSGIATWGLANGGALLWGLIQSARTLPERKEMAARPWRLVLLVGVALFFLWIGGTVVWGIVKNLFR